MGFAVLLAAAGGLSVANVYYAQPLLDQIGAALHVDAGSLGLATTVTQLGYLIGLILIVPLGDLVDQRVLILAQTLAAAVALAAVGLSGSAAAFFTASALVGLASTVVQVIVAHAAATSRPEHRGRVVGIVTSGVVIGILLARTASGLIADLLGWRAAFLLPAALMLLTAAALARLLPRTSRAKHRIPYRRLATSAFVLTARDRTFRTRSILALLMFGSFGALWGSVALPLADAPWHLSSGQIGLFGIAGAAGALGAGNAGRLADRGLAQRVSGAALVLLLLSWAAIQAAPRSLILLAAGAVLLDFAGQALHVISQHLIVAEHPTAGSQVIGGYMVFYSIGTGGGAIAATTLYSHAGWNAVTLLGATLAALALLVWAVDRIALRHRAPRLIPRPRPEFATPPDSRYADTPAARTPRRTTNRRTR